MINHLEMTGQGGEIPRILDVKGENPSERITFGRLVLFLQVYENLSLICSIGIFMLKSYIVTYLQICTSTSSALSFTIQSAAGLRSEGCCPRCSPRPRDRWWRWSPLESSLNECLALFCFLKKVPQKREPR